MKAIPHRCPQCCSEIVEGEDSEGPYRYQNFVGRLVFAGDPPNPTCVVCQTPLVPSSEFGRQGDLTDRAVS